MTERVRRALFSVTETRGLVDFAKGLKDRGFMLIASGGTALALEAGGVKAMQVKDFTGMPEIFSGRVKTIHPKIAGGILADRSSPDHLAEAERHGIPLIDVVCVNFYKFQSALSDPNRTYWTVVEKIDVGGPGLVVAGVKNHDSVIIVTDPNDYPEVFTQLDQWGGSTLEFRHTLARKAVEQVAEFYRLVGAGLAGFSTMQDGRVVRLSKTER